MKPETEILLLVFTWIIHGGCAVVVLWQTVRAIIRGNADMIICGLIRLPVIFLFGLAMVQFIKCEVIC